MVCNCMRVHSISRILACGLLGALCACTTPSPQSLAERDPWESTNRDIFDANIWVEHHVAKPVVEVYRDVVPTEARDAVHNALTNMHAPVILANDILQARPEKAMQTTERVVINSTI